MSTLCVYVFVSAGRSWCSLPVCMSLSELARADVHFLCVYLCQSWWELMFTSCVHVFVRAGEG